MHHFRQRLRFCHLNMWTQVRQFTVLRFRCDYILVTNRRPLKLLGIRDMSNYSLYNFSLWARLLWRPTFCLVRYLRGRHAFPLFIPVSVYLSVVDTKLQDLKYLNPPPPPCPP